jgi:hypothetical protein
MEKKFNVLFLIIAVVFMSSCAPIHETYYNIVAGGADSIVQNYCRGTTPFGPFGTAIFKAHNNVSLEITSTINNKNLGLAIKVLLKIPKGVSVIFKDNNFVLKDLSSGVIQNYKVTYSYYYHKYIRKRNIRQVDIFSTLEGETRIIGNKFFGRSEIHKRYYATAHFGEISAEKYLLFMPELEINGKTFNFQEIIFIRESGWFISPINC